jgi:tetratricopeptide (TPR) repeat protein
MVSKSVATSEHTHRPKKGRSLFLRIAILVGLLVIIGAVFFPVIGYDFINYDDDIYVINNDHLGKGISLEAIRWAATSTDAAMYAPLTWLSYLVDIELFGRGPAGHHLVNVLLHALNAILLFLVLEGLTGSRAKSGLVAALFAVHPQHVESVAWIAERKGVLSALFWMLALVAYLRYAKAGRQQAGRRTAYICLCVFYLLGLLSKPIVLTLPFALLLLDYWPLNRTAIGSHTKLATARKSHGASFKALLLEKAPLFALSGLSIAVTYFAQSKGGAVRSLESLSISMRITNSIVAYAKYLGKTIWPTNLVVLYPLPEGLLPAWQIAGACLLLIVVTGVVLTKVGKQPSLPVGWLWFLGTLVPVIGLLQVGTQHTADRYTYLPTIGLFVAGAWAIPVTTKRWLGGAGIRSGAALAILACLIWISSKQVGLWKDSVTLFGYAVARVENNPQGHDHLGTALAARGEYEESLAHFLEAIRIDPGIADVLKPRIVKSYSELGDRLLQEGRLEEAVANYRHALGFSRSYPMVHNRLAVALARQGKEIEAIASFSQALELDPALREAHFNLALTLEHQGKTREAIAHYEAARRLSPGDREIADYLQRAVEKEKRR